MSEAKTLADLSPFFAKKEARAIIVTDCKLDDALCLWYFFLLNLSRPAGHRVHIDIFVVGIKDLAGGVALATHVFQEAKKYASTARRNASAVHVDFEVYASKGPYPPKGVRHEPDTFAPYGKGQQGFPKADPGSLKYFQNKSASMFGATADFVGVICQYLAWVVIDRQTSGFDADMLDYIVPKAGGMLAFQMGFNTRFPGSHDEQKAVWDALHGKVRSAGAKMAFISNAFSFTKGDLKPGTVDPHSAPFVATLKQQSAQLWDHLFKAAIIESSIFACDQIAKWIVGVEPVGVAVHEVPDEAKNAAMTFCQALQIAASRDLRDLDSVSASIKAVVNSGEAGVAKVLSACVDLHAACGRACGDDAVDYLTRSEAALKKFGITVEVTDGQHFLALFQSVVPVLHPFKEVTWVDGPKCFGVQFGDTGGGAEDIGGDAVMWAASDIDVAQSFEWMCKGTQVPAGYSLTLPRSSPVEMRVAAGRAPSFYAASARNLLTGADGQSPLTATLIICGLGAAVQGAASAAAAMEREGVAIIEKLETGFVDPTAGRQTRRAEPQLRITLRRAQPNKAE